MSKIVKPIMLDETGKQIVEALRYISGASPEQIEYAVSKWLSEHPEATTTVADGSVSINKLAADVKTAILNSAAADEEDITKSSDNKLMLKNRDNANGMGYVILRKGKSFAEQVSATDTIYEIRYDFDLNNSPVTIKDNCVLKFVGGKLKNGTLRCNLTNINADAVQIFDNVSMTGTLANSVACVEWFGAMPNSEEDSADAIQHCIDAISSVGGGEVRLFASYYTIKHSLFMRANVTLKGCGQSNRENINISSLHCVFADTNSWAIDSKCLLKKTGDTTYKEYVADYNDITFDDIVKTGTQNSDSRTSSIKIIGVNIVNKSGTPLYGGIRLYTPLYSVIENSSVVGTIAGIAVRSAWNFTIENTLVYTYRYGIVYGQDTTTAMTKNVYVSKGGRELSASQKDAFTLPNFRDGFFPPYIGTLQDGSYVVTDDDKKNYSCAFCYNGNSHLTHYNPIVETYDMLSGGVTYSAQYINPYIEDVKMALWNSGTTIFPGDTVHIDGCLGTGIKNILDNYMFGVANNVKVFVKDFPFGRCYPSTSSNVDHPSYSDKFVFDLSKNNYAGVWYDSWEIDENGNYINCKKSYLKKFVNIPDTANCSSTSADSKIRIGSGTYSDNISSIEGLERGFKKLYRARKNPFVEEFKDGDVELIEDQTNASYNLSSPIVLNNSSVLFNAIDKSFSPTTTSNFKDNAFDVKGNCVIAFNKKNGGFANYLNPTFTSWIRIVGDCDVKIYTPENYSGHARTKIIFNPTCKYKYVVRCYTSDGVLYRTYSSDIGPTDSKPVLTSAEAGREYYDTTLKKKIVWNGTAWTNLDGSAL